MKYALVNLGCKVNRVESDAVHAALDGLGAHVVSDGSADIVIVNTCTVTGEAEKKTRKAIRHAMRQNPDASVLVTGCAAAIDPAGIEALGEHVHVVAKPDVVHQALLRSGELPNFADDVHGAHLEVPISDALRVGDSYPTRVGIKVQDGCNNACTYCIVHVARGKARSIDPARIVTEAQRLEAVGVREIVLTGINLGSYRVDSLELSDLLEQLLHALSSARIRVSSIEPRDVTDKLIDVVAASNGRICRHFHLPLQSGSTEVLRQMARPYTAEQYMELVDRIRDAMPHFALSTDVICGFPGETDKQFEDTRAICEYARFARIHVFRYSKRVGTPAALRSDQISPEIIAERSRNLVSLGRELARRDACARIGTTEQVLIENLGRATTESYHTVHLKGYDSKESESVCNVSNARSRDAFNFNWTPGQLVPMKLTHVDENGDFVL